MATVVAEVVNGVVVQDETDFGVLAIPFAPWCCADPWRRIRCEGTIGTAPEIAGLFLSPSVVMRWEGATDMIATFGFGWIPGAVSPVSLGGTWLDPVTGAADWGSPFGAAGGPEGGNSPRVNPGDPYRFVVEWDASGGDPTPVATFYVNDMLSASAYFTGIHTAMLANGYSTVPDPAAVGIAVIPWGTTASAPMWDISAMVVECAPAPSDFPALVVPWQDLP